MPMFNCGPRGAWCDAYPTVAVLNLGAAPPRGWTWEQHLDEGGQEHVLTESKFDLAVLQNHSLRWYEDVNAFRRYGDQLAKIALKSGAKLWLFFACTREGQSDRQRELIFEYQTLVDSHQGNLVPVGTEQSTTQRGHLNLVSELVPTRFHTVLRKSLRSATPGPDPSLDVIEVDDGFSSAVVVQVVDVAAGK